MERHPVRPTEGVVADEVPQQHSVVGGVDHSHDWIIAGCVVDRNRIRKPHPGGRPRGVGQLRTRGEVRLPEHRSADSHIGDAVGLHHLGRFTVTYKGRLGESPSQTLKS